MQERLQSQFRELIAHYGWWALPRLLLAPLTAPFSTFYRIIQLSISCRPLWLGRWTDYAGFDPWRCLIAQFYFNQAMLIARYGLNGTCNYLGLGNYRLSGWWHLALPSIFAYWKFPAIVPLLGMLIWWLGWSVWLGVTSEPWVFLIMALLGCSTAVYGQATSRQNYNVMGWMFWPLGLFGILQGCWGLASLAWLLASFGSFTAIFTASIICAWYSLGLCDIHPLLTLLPGLMKLCTHFSVNLEQGNLFERLSQTAKAIGLKRGGTRYAYQYREFIGTRALYITSLCALFGLVSYLINPLWWLYLGAFLLYLLNYLKRFADEQSVEIVALSVATAITLKYPSTSQFAALWVLACPIPLLDLRFQGWKILDIVPRLRPLDFRPLMQNLNQFLSTVSEGQRVLMSHDDPCGSYNRVFEGLTALKEPLHYLAARKKVHLLPDWWAVQELNFHGSPDFWGRDPQEVLGKAREWKADFVIIYTVGGATPAADFSRLGFIHQASFDWSDFPEIYPDSFQLETPPRWWLLEVPQ